jgi:hypothetical protein
VPIGWKQSSQRSGANDGVLVVPYRVFYDVGEERAFVGGPIHESGAHLHRFRTHFGCRPAPWGPRRTSTATPTKQTES